MTRQRHSVDGFVPRRPGAPLGGTSRDSKNLPPVRSAARREVNEVRPLTRPSEASHSKTVGISRSEIDESLQGIDDKSPKTRKRKFHLSAKNIKRIIKWVLIFALVVGIGIAAYLGFKAFFAAGNIFKGNVFDVIQTQPLKMDANGRSNFLILGTSDDDPGHDASSLTDSMMILSVDQNKKNAYMISIPRDLYVQFGQACPGGYQSKINEYFSCIGGDPENVKATQDALMKEAGFIGKIFDLEIQYGVNLNYTVMRDLVKAVGGSLTITIESRDPNGQLDSNFDWKCGVGDRKVSRAEVIKRCPPRGHFIDLPNGPVTLDAERVLYLAQARGDAAPTYGFEQSNFDREKNQQKIIKALREKAVSAGVVTDFVKVGGILDALGNNLRTTIDSKEIRTLMNLAKDIKTEDIRSIPLNNPDNPMMVTGRAGGASIVRPAAGLFDYSELQAYVKKELLASPATREQAKIAIMNASGVTGAAQTEADKLAAKGLVVGELGNTEGDFGKVKIYQIDKKKTATAAELQKIYGVKPVTTTPPVTVTGDTAFVVVIGTIAKANDTSGSSQ